MEITLKKLLNALFPKEDEDAQILNKKPIKVLGKLGPVIGLITILCLLLTQMFGGGINISQGFILFSLSLFIVVFLFFSKKLKQKKRNPVIFFSIHSICLSNESFGIKNSIRKTSLLGTH